MEREGAAWQDCETLGTVVHVALEGRYVGHIVIADRLKDGAAETVRALKSLGVRKTVMLTGDRQPVAERVAGQLGLDEVRAELLPADKVAAVEALLAVPDPPRHARICRGRAQRRARAVALGRGHCHGRSRLGRRYRGGGRRAHGRPAGKAGAGRAHCPPDAPDRDGEHRVCAGRQGGGACAWGPRALRACGSRCLRTSGCVCSRCSTPCACCGGRRDRRTGMASAGCAQAAASCRTKKVFCTSEYFY